MKLLTQEIIKALPPLYSTEKIPLENKMVICKFFMPDSYWTWFVFEGERQEKSNNEDYLFYGMVHGHEEELGYFLLSELMGLRGPLGLKVERDRSVFKKPYGTFSF